MRNLGCLLMFLVGCGGSGAPIELQNALVTSSGAQGAKTSLHRTTRAAGVQWHQFYFDCMQASPCMLDLEVRLADAALQKRLTDVMVMEPSRAVVTTSQLLLYSAEHAVNLRFNQGVLRDFTSGDVRMVDTISLDNQPNNLRYNVSVAFPELADDAEASRLVPDD